MRNFKLNITTIPTYLDGIFELFAIIQDGDSRYPKESIISLNKSMNYKSISITDKLKYELNQRSENELIKIRIPQTKEIGSLNVLKIEEKYFKVYNAYHFINSDGFPETDLTLEYYPNAKVVENNVEQN